MAWHHRGPSASVNQFQYVKVRVERFNDVKVYIWYGTKKSFRWNAQIFDELHTPVDQMHKNPMKCTPPTCCSSMIFALKRFDPQKCCFIFIWLSVSYVLSYLGVWYLAVNRCELGLFLVSWRVSFLLGLSLGTATCFGWILGCDYVVCGRVLWTL